jgi:hypothetical protein
MGSPPLSTPHSAGWLMNVQEIEAKLNELDPVRGVTLMNVLELPEPVAKVLREVMRLRSVSLPQFAEALALGEGEASQLADVLVEKGFLRLQQRPSEATPTYRVRFDHSGGRGLASSVWDSFIE